MTAGGTKQPGEGLEHGRIVVDEMDRQVGRIHDD